MKNWFGFAIFAFVLSVNCSGFYHEFSQEPYINFMPSRTHEKNKFIFSLQHNYNDSKIASANLRLGYGVYNNLNLYLSGLFHSVEVNSGGVTSDVSVKEPEIGGLVSLLKENETQKFDLALFVGASRYIFRQKNSGAVFTDDRNFYAAYLIFAKNISDKILLLDIAPALVLDSGKKNTAGVFTGLKLNYNEKIALITEQPFLVKNPYEWKRPYSYGLQIHIGPHILTLFATNTYGFTISNILQGLDRTFYGFRFSI